MHDLFGSNCRVELGESYPLLNDVDGDGQIEVAQEYIVEKDGRTESFYALRNVPHGKSKRNMPIVDGVSIPGVGVLKTGSRISFTNQTFESSLYHKLDKRKKTSIRDGSSGEYTVKNIRLWIDSDKNGDPKFRYDITLKIDQAPKDELGSDVNLKYTVEELQNDDETGHTFMFNLREININTSNFASLPVRFLDT